MNLTCHPNDSYVPITDEIKEAILRGHNENRDIVAQGKLDGVFLNQTASRMTTLVSDFLKVVLCSSETCNAFIFGTFN